MPQAESEEKSLAEQIATELGRCRQRGLDDLDKVAHNQQRIEADRLEELARGYCEALGVQLNGRIVQTRRMLEDGLAAYRKDGNDKEAALIEKLLFDPDGTPRRLPGERLRDVRGKMSGSTFRNVQRALFVGLARFLIAFVRTAQEDPSSARLSSSAVSRFICDHEVRGHEGDIWISIQPSARATHVTLGWGAKRAYVLIDEPTSLSTRKGADDWPLFVYVRPPALAVTCGPGDPPPGPAVRDINLDWR
jgi:hypothetical protein